ncbi:MAG: IS1380 family transposase [Solirubrobacterales bacterium]
MVSHAGSALLGQVADKSGLTKALSRGLSSIRQRRGGHDPGHVIRDLAVMLADGGEALSDLGAVREQAPLFGAVASDSTAYRLIDQVASAPELLDALRAAHGFHPLLAYFDEPDEAAAAKLRPGNAGANTAADQIEVSEAALEQIPAELVAEIGVLLRVDSAGASHELLDWAHEGNIRFSVGYSLSEAVRSAIEALPESAWSAAQSQDGTERPNGEVAEITDLLDLGSWPEGSRLIVRRERPHPGAQLSFTDHDGHRFQAILTDQAGEIAAIERRHRHRARVEDQIKDDKDTGLAKLPFRDFQMNAVWLELVGLAHNLISWTKSLLLRGELARSQPQRLRPRLLHVAGRLAFSGRRAKLRLQASWPWAGELAAAFARLQAYRRRPAEPGSAAPRQLDPPPAAPRQTKPAHGWSRPRWSGPRRPTRRHLQPRIGAHHRPRCQPAADAYLTRLAARSGLGVRPGLAPPPK